MKKIKLQTVVLSIGLACLTGCVGWIVPKTSITGSVGGQPFSLQSPKDVEIGSLNVKAETNGTLSLCISNMVSKNNPAVIQTTADAQVQLINAVGAQIMQAASKGAAGAVKP